MTTDMSYDIDQTETHNTTHDDSLYSYLIHFYWIRYSRIQGVTVQYI